MSEPSTSATGRAPSAAGDAGWAPPLVLYVGTLVVLLVVSWQTITHVAVNPLGISTAGFAGDWFWGGWVRFDGGWYHGIAERGYSHVPDQQSSVAFFPGYPLTIRTVGRSIGNVPLGAILTTIACGLGVMVLFYRWCAARMDPALASVAVACLALYPYAWYLYGAVYGDALFLVLVLGSFTLLERDQPALAGLVGAAATATRVTGLALVVGLVIGVIERRGGLRGTWRWGLPRRIDPRCLRVRDLAVTLSIAGLIAWAGWLWHRFGDPLLFVSVQEEWGQPSSPRTWLKVDFFAQLLRSPDRIHAYGLVVQAAAALGALLLVPAIIRRFGLRYGAYVAVLILMPAIGSQNFHGLGRYLLGAFPAFALIGEGLAARPEWARLVLPASAALLVLGTAWFAHGLYLA